MSELKETSVADIKSKLDLKPSYNAWKSGSSDLSYRWTIGPAGFKAPVFPLFSTNFLCCGFERKVPVILPTHDPAHQQEILLVSALLCHARTFPATPSLVITCDLNRAASYMNHLDSNARISALCLSKTQKPDYVSYGDELPDEFVRQGGKLPASTEDMLTYLNAQPFEDPLPSFLKAPLEFEVYVATFESVLANLQLFNGISWRVCVFDTTTNPNRPVTEDSPTADPVLLSVADGVKSLKCQYRLFVTPSAPFAPSGFRFTKNNGDDARIWSSLLFPEQHNIPQSTAISFVQAITVPKERDIQNNIGAV